MAPQPKQKDTSADLLWEQTGLGRGSGGLPDKQPTQVYDLVTGSLLGVESVGKLSVSGSVGAGFSPRTEISGVDIPPSL